MSDALAGLGHEVEVEPMDDLDISVFDGGGDFLIVSSTYGQGDVPDNAMALYEGLVQDKPDLGGVRYGVFSLGDMTYSDTFNFGGKRFDKAMEECGRPPDRHNLHPRRQFPARSRKTTASEWVKEWIGNFSGGRALAA